MGNEDSDNELAVLIQDEQVEDSGDDGPSGFSALLESGDLLTKRTPMAEREEITTATTTKTRS